eukprot:358171-Chlamydomonas_euryale.AAC.3
MERCVAGARAAPTSQFTGVHACGGTSAWRGLHPCKPLHPCVSICAPAPSPPSATSAPSPPSATSAPSPPLCALGGVAATCAELPRVALPPIFARAQTLAGYERTQAACNPTATITTCTDRTARFETWPGWSAGLHCAPVPLCLCDPVPSQRVWHDAQPSVGYRSLGYPSSITDNSMGPDMMFGRTLLEMGGAPSGRVGFVPTAVSGSALDDWMPDKDNEFPRMVQTGGGGGT